MKKFLPYFILLIVSLFGTKALLHSGFYTSHDGEHQVIRLYQFYKTLSLGQFPPRWAGDLLNGYGYPLFNFNYQLPWFMALPFYLIGASLTDSVKFTFIAGFFLSGITMCLFLKEVFGGKAGLFGAFLYLWAPYRFSNIFVRASLGEATAFIFTPLLFWGIYKLRNGFSWKAIAIGVLGIFGIVLSHLMILILFIAPMFIFFLSLLYTTERKKEFLLSTLVLALLGIGLSGYYVIPAVVEQSLTKFKDIMPLFYMNHFVTLQQLLYSKWGYGFSDGLRSGMSFQVGVGQWIVAVLGVGLFCLKKIGKRALEIPNLHIAFFSIIAFLFSIFMMVGYSAPIWKLFERTVSLDYPWRFLSVSIFSVSILGAWIFNTLQKNKLFLSLTILFVLVVFYTNRNHLNVNQYVYNRDSFYTENQGTTNTYDEYTPRWVQSSAIKEKPKVLIRSDDSSYEINLRRKNTYRLLSFDTFGKEGKLRANIVYFPGWKVLIDGKSAKIDYEGDGLIEFNVPGGKHQVDIAFGESTVRMVADVVSLCSIFVLFGGFYFRGFFKKKD